jgi:FkbM family methyltransferase
MSLNSPPPPAEAKSPRIQQWLRDRYWRIKSDLLYHHLYEMLNLEYTLQSGVVLRVASKGEWWTYNDIFVNQEYDLPIRKALESRSSRSSFTVLDLGANVGYFCLRVLDLMRQSGLQTVAADMTLVEGSPAVYRDLQHRLGSQDLSPMAVRMFHGLVGLRQGSGAILESAIHVKNTIMHHRTNNAVKVEFVDLSPVMQDRPEIDLLKCDIEGAELLFIENYRDLLTRVKNAVFEFHDELCDTAMCLKLLEQAGLRQQVLRSSSGISVRFFSRTQDPHVT